MSNDSNALTGKKATSSGFSFPAHLLQPQKSQITRSEDSVASSVMRMNSWAQKLGEGFGISYTEFSLNPLQPNPDTLAAVILAFAHRNERVSLERRSGKWGLYFTREPAAFAQDRTSEAVPLKDAPLDVRERFLLKSEEFFRGYLDLCEGRLRRMHGAVSQADRTLEMLENLQLK